MINDVIVQFITNFGTTTGLYFMTRMIELLYSLLYVSADSEGRQRGWHHCVLEREICP